MTDRYCREGRQDAQRGRNSTPPGSMPSRTPRGGAVSPHITLFQSLRSDGNLGAKRQCWCFWNSSEYLADVSVTRVLVKCRFAIITSSVSWFHLNFPFPSGVSFPKECGKRRAAGYLMPAEEGPGPERTWRWR